MECYGVIMAGGGGTRFWPLSRQKTPKQLLNLSGRDLMVNETVDRFAMTIPGKNMFIVTNVSQVDAMRKATAGRVLPEHILAEPSARNTAACIGYAAFEILRKHGDGILCVTPSDAYVKDWAEFNRVLGVAVKAAEERDMLVTIGITPTFPATGYGYIQFDQGEPAEARAVARFVEKPDEETARHYFESGNFAWNSGIFVWKASTILEHFKRLLPDIYAELSKIADAMNTPSEEPVLFDVYPTIRKISVDYGIMEKSDDVLVVSGEFGWNDVGSWDMMKVLHDADDAGNITLGNVLAIDTTDSVAYSSGRLIAAVGVDNLVIVETPDAVLVCRKDRAQDVKKAVEALQTQGRTEYL